MSTSFQGAHHFPTLGQVLQRRNVEPNTLGALRSSEKPPARNIMKVYFMALTGVFIDLDVHPDDTVAEVKANIVKCGGPRAPKLTFGGRRMDNERAKLSEFEVGPKDTLYEECDDLPALVAFYNGLNGDNWVSSLRCKANQDLHDLDQSKVAVLEGAGEVHTNEKTKITRYVHTARQAAFDSQSLPPARHLPYAKDWPDPIGVDLEYEAPGSVRLRRDAWRVVKPPPVALGVIPYNPQVGPKDGDASKQKKKEFPDEPLSLKSPKSPPAAVAAAAKGGATKADKAKEAKEAAAKKKAAKKRGSILAVKAAPVAALPSQEEVPDIGLPGLREDRFLDTEASDLPTSARTDPRVDFHGPANWFGVTTEPRPDHTTSPGADDNYNNDGGVDADDNIDDENNSSRMKASMRLRVTKLEMQHNGLAGSLPIVPLGQLAELEILNLSGQAFSSVRPPEHEKNVEADPTLPSGKLRGWIVLGRPGDGTRNLKTVPTSLASLSNLQEIDLSANVLTGPLPGAPMPAWANKLTGKRAFKAKAAAIMAQNSMKKKMSFAGKSAGGSAGAGPAGGPPVPLNASASSAPLPPPSSSSSGLSSLLLARAPKKEEVPPPLGWACASTLRILKLQANRFTGPLPEAMSELSALEVLRLDGNKLTGTLPLACFACAASSSSHGARSSTPDNANNNSNNIMAMTRKSTGLAPWHRLIELRLGGGNSFDGPLPPHLGDACPSLETLTLDGNKFTGPLPPSMGACLALEHLDLSRCRRLYGPLPIDKWLQPQPCPACQATHQEFEVEDEGYGEGEVWQHHGMRYNGGAVRPGGCRRWACSNGWVAPMRRLALLGLMECVRIDNRHGGAEKLRVAVGEGLRVALDPFLPHFTRADADADDQARDLAEQQAIAAKEARLAAKVAAARAPYEALKQKDPSQKAAMAEVEEEETVAMKVERAARERQAKEDAEATAEAANDQDCVREWRQGAAQLVPESVFQLAMAYELGLFGVKRNRSKAIKLYASLANAPGGEDDGETGTNADEKRLPEDQVEDKDNISNESSGGSSGSVAEDKTELKDFASNPSLVPSSAARALAANEMARLEAEDRNDFVSGGAPAKPDPKASSEADGAAEEAKKKKVIKSKPAPVMATFGYQIHSPFLEASYGRNRQQTTNYM